MAEQHGSYYVPEYSAWPIIVAFGLLCLALGSLNFDSLLGTIAFFLGVAVLIVSITGWLANVITESRKGLYDAQMDRTFYWGMFWFLFCEAFLFGVPLATLLYTRIATIPWLAGTGSGGSLMTHYLLWPDFTAGWPLLKNPNPSAFLAPKAVPSGSWIPVINTLIILGSAISATLSWWALRKNYRVAMAYGLILAIFLGGVFLYSQINYCWMLIDTYSFSFSGGIYTNLFFFLYGIHGLHIAAGLIMLIIVLVLALRRFFSPENFFGYAATILFWDFLAIVWLIIFASIYLPYGSLTS